MSGTTSGLDARHLRGPFAVIGDVHGCVHTLDALLRALGGSLDSSPDGLTLVSVGDLHDKAGPHEGLHGEPGSVEVLRWALRETAAKRLITVDSNHGQALLRFLRGDRSFTGGDAAGAELTAVELASAADADELVPAVEQFLEQCPPFARFRGGRWNEFIVAHAAVAERTLDARSLNAREHSFHVRAHDFRWTAPYAAVTGHVSVTTPTVTAEKRPDGTHAGPVIRIDTGVDERGMLTAYLPHEHRFVSVAHDARDTVLTAHESRLVPA